jgi:hypothetical protein
MHRLLVLALTTLVALSVSASPARAQGVSGGIKGGALFASIPKLTDNTQGTGIEFGRRLGFAGGMFVTLDLLPGLSIQPEVIFTQKGAAAEDADVDWTLRLDYIDIPVLARLDVGAAGVRAYLFGGPSFNVNIRARTTVDGDDEDIGDDVEKREIAVVAGLGLQVGKFLVEGRWTEGVKNISKDPEEDLRTRSFAIMAGLRF